MTGCVRGPSIRVLGQSLDDVSSCSLTRSQLTPRHTTVISDLSCFLFIECVRTSVLFSDNFPYPRIACPCLRPIQMLLSLQIQLISYLTYSLNRYRDRCRDTYVFPQYLRSTSPTKSYPLSF